MAASVTRTGVPTLWGSGPGFGMDPNMLLAWHYHAGGKALLDEIPGAYKDIDVVALATEEAGLSRRVVKLVPIGNIKG